MVKLKKFRLMKEGVKLMNTLDYTISKLETTSPLTPLTEDMLVSQLTNSMKKSDMGMVTSADEVSRRMKEKYEF
jgi:hypothetical protein